MTIGTGRESQPAHHTQDDSLRSVDAFAVLQPTLWAKKYSKAFDMHIVLLHDSPRSCMKGGKLMIVYMELSSLVHDLGFSSKVLYGVSNQVGKHYHQVSIPKANGSTRSLHVPDAQLKAIQRKINDVLLAPEPISPCATAYRPGCSTKINAMLHVGQPVLLKLDILHFFDSITYPMVKEKVFPADRFSEANRILLTILCTHQEAVPQGAPTSPAISNIIMRDFDSKIGAWCERHSIGYTRYCDDMTFSGYFDPEQLIDLVKSELRKMGFFLNGKKTTLVRDGRQKIVTGLVVN